MDRYKICVIKGDGIGPEIADEAIKVLDSASAKFGFGLDYEYFLMGGAAIDVFPSTTLSAAATPDTISPSSFRSALTMYEPAGISLDFHTA